MDPQVAWKEMLEAFQQGDWDGVREFAEGLMHWMDHGGFPPETWASNRAASGVLTEQPHSLGPGWNRTVAQAACRYALDLANQVLNDPIGIPRRVSFTLSCRNCDIDGPSSFEAAAAAGWKDIRFTPLNVAKNFLGICPTCQSPKQ